MELHIVEQNGWSKPVKIERAITRIGSDPSNDIQLRAENIAAVHLQVLYSSITPASCKVVNLAGEITARIARQARPLASYAVVDLSNGDEILLGDYWISFSLPLSSGVMQSARMIDATLSFDEAIVRPGAVTVGRLTIKNAGQQPACQFQVQLGGLPADCYQIDPIPLMYPGAQEEVRLRIFQRGLEPAAGNLQLTINISAPESYPGEELILHHGLHVTPVFKQALELIDDLSPAAKPQEVVQPPSPPLENKVWPQTAPAVIMKGFEPRPETILPEAQLSQPAGAPAPVTVAAVSAWIPAEQEAPEAPAQIKTSVIAQKPKPTPTASQPAPDISRLKVVRGPADADNFWDEK